MCGVYGECISIRASRLISLPPLAAMFLPPPPSPVLYAGLSLEGEWVTRKVTLFCIEGMIPVSKWIRDPMRVVKEFSTQVVVDILHEDLHRAS